MAFLKSIFFVLFSCSLSHGISYAIHISPLLRGLENMLLSESNLLDVLHVLTTQCESHRSTPISIGLLWEYTSGKTEEKRLLTKTGEGELNAQARWGYRKYTTHKSATDLVTSVADVFFFLLLLSLVCFVCLWQSVLDKYVVTPTDGKVFFCPFR